MAIFQECPRCKKRQAVARKRCKCGEDLDKAKRSGRVEFYIDYYLPGNKRRRKHVKGNSIDLARKALNEVENKKDNGRSFELLRESKKKITELVEWFVGQEKIKALSYYVAIQSHLKLFSAMFGDKLVNDLKPVDLEDLQVRLQKEGRAPSYIDQVIDTARHMVSKAIDNDLIAATASSPSARSRAS